MAQTEEASLEERLKSALWLSIGKIVDEETIKLGVNATPQFIGALTEMVWAQIETISQDLESFANTSNKKCSNSIFSSRHAGRSTVNVSDVMLLARRNEGLDSILRAFVEQEKQRQEDP
ncbi:Pc21g20860 [Penicillium rubens Wisconsin 54-1255]|uniref:Pc21g20860 protein n=1 Tax=Penicillium rubens (strain ATCC 28089 / DSM 1075 / NRRL 1951 / Wisconsin 54-1255) TaxID=500485 RepID=B6HLE3_PENRW|nr:Pc21g20860 [Penicillium rubens Wisconsin 54-1255]